MKYSKAGDNRIIVRALKAELYDDKQKGLLIDVSWEPQKHVKGQAVVEAIPEKALYGMECEGIVPEVRVGDTVIIHYSVIDDGGFQGTPNYIDEDKYFRYYWVDYFHIYMAKGPEDKDWKMIGSWVLCDEHYENCVSDYTYVDPITKVEVSTKVVLSDSGLVSSVNVGRSSRIAKIHNIGTPKTTANHLGLKKGDLVIFRRNLDGEIKVGRDVFVLLKQNELLAKL